MKKLFIIMMVGVLLFGSFLFYNSDKVDMNRKDFNYCKQPELFGLKYTGCQDINCIKFHEDVKRSLREEYC